jgi:cytochrome P450
METMKFALHVIAGAGFGVPFDWESDATASKAKGGHKLTLQQAVNTVLHHLPPIVLVPRLLWKLPIPYLRATELGYTEFGTYMRELLDHERELLNDKGISDRSNLLAAIVKNSASETDAEARLQDTEIIGNVFIFLIAGHETS